jgi:DNA-binding transcriptional ArsR family regulator
MNDCTYTAIQGESMIDNDVCGIRLIHEDRVEEARIRALPDEDIKKTASVFKILGDPNRLKLLEALYEGEMCVCDISVFLGLSESAASHQLRVLKSYNLVLYRKEKQCCYYSLANDNVKSLISLCREMGAR